MAESPPPPKKRGAIPEPEPEPEKAYTYDLGPDMLDTLTKAFNLVQKKSSKKKPNEVDEKDVAVMMRALGFNPTEQHIEIVILKAREDQDPKHTTKGHLDFDNLQRKIAELFGTDESLSYRHSENEIIGALRALCPAGQDYIEVEDLYNVMTDKGVPFTDEEALNMIRIGKDRDTGKIWHEDYALIVANDSIPPPPNIIKAEIILTPEEVAPPPPPPPPPPS